MVPWAPRSSILTHIHLDMLCHQIFWDEGCGWSFRQCKRHQETRAVDISYHVESFNFFSLAVQVVGIKSFRTVLYWLAGVQPSRYILWRFQGNEDREERNLILFCRHSIPVFTYTRFDSSSTTTLFPQRCPLDFLVLASWFRVSGNYRH